MTRKFSAAQYAYLVAKAQVEALTDAFKIEMAKYDHLTADRSDEASIRRYCEISVAIEDTIGLTAAYDMLHQSEDALLSWAQATVRNDLRTRAQYAKHASDLQQLFDKAINWQSYSVRTRLIDLTLKMQPV